jgi:hypothetical protein
VTEPVSVDNGQEAQLLLQLKDVKQNYKENFAQLQSVKGKKSIQSPLTNSLGEIEYTTRLIDKCREKSVMEFEQWYAESFDHGSAKPASDPQEKETEDMMDYQEKFEKMNLEKVIAEDPESSAYYNARKNVYGVKAVGLPKITKKAKKGPFRL